MSSSSPAVLLSTSLTGKLSVLFLCLWGCCFFVCVCVCLLFIFMGGGGGGGTEQNVKKRKKKI